MIFKKSQTSQPVTGSQPSRSNKLWLALGLALVIVCAAIVLIVVYHQKSQPVSKASKSMNNQPPTSGYVLVGVPSQDYAQNEGYKILAPYDLRTPVAQKPANLNTKTPQPTRPQEQLILRHEAKTGKTTYPTSGVEARVVISDKPFSDQDVSQVSQSITDQNSASPSITPAKDFATGQLSQWYDLSFAAQSEAIKLNAGQAWQVDITGKPKLNTQSINGKLIYAIGHRTAYYFLIYSSSKDWQSNKAKWDHVITSIKIDQ